MPETTPLTPERIREAAEEVLRRFGPAKATVVDVARHLGVSHGSIYKHYPSKTALREDVTRVWLERTEEPLARIAAEDGSATDRLRRWLDYLIAAKHSRALDDPELFANYLELASEAREVVSAHREALVAQLARIVADGIAQGEFRSSDLATTARALFDATVRFQNPAHAAEWSDPNIGSAFEAVWQLLLNGLSVEAVDK